MTKLNLFKEWEMYYVNFFLRINHILKEKNSMVILIEKKHSVKFHSNVWLKALSKLGIEGTFINFTKDIYENVQQVQEQVKVAYYHYYWTLYWQF